MINDNGKIWQILKHTHGLFPPSKMFETNRMETDKYQWDDFNADDCRLKQMAFNPLKYVNVAHFLPFPSILWLSRVE